LKEFGMNVRVFISTLVTGLFLVGLISGCTIPLPNATPESTTDSAATTDTAAAPAEGGAMATVSARSLRVRQDPNEASESYRVLALSDDGQWIQLAIDSSPTGAGWVSANFVTVEGDITDLAVGNTAAAAPVTTTATTTDSVAAPAVTLVPTPQPGFALVSTEGIRLRVRSEPTTDSPIVGYAYDGETYQVIATSGDGLWVQIPPATGDNTDNPDGGWVAAEFLLIGQ
jgi:hypothetical protein